MFFASNGLIGHKIVGNQPSIISAQKKITESVFMCDHLFFIISLNILLDYKHYKQHKEDQGIIQLEK